MKICKWLVTGNISPPLSVGSYVCMAEAETHGCAPVPVPKGFWCCVLGLIRVNTCVKVAASGVGWGEELKSKGVTLPEVG